LSLVRSLKAPSPSSERVATTAASSELALPDEHHDPRNLNGSWTLTLFGMGRVPTYVRTCANQKRVKYILYILACQKKPYGVGRATLLLRRSLLARGHVGRPNTKQCRSYFFRNSYTFLFSSFMFAPAAADGSSKFRIHRRFVSGEVAGRPRKLTALRSLMCSGVEDCW